MHAIHLVKTGTFSHQDKKGVAGFFLRLNIYTHEVVFLQYKIEGRRQIINSITDTSYSCSNSIPDTSYSCSNSIPDISYSCSNSIT